MLGIFEISKMYESQYLILDTLQSSWKTRQICKQSSNIARPKIHKEEQTNMCPWEAAWCHVLALTLHWLDNCQATQPQSLSPSSVRKG